MAQGRTVFEPPILHENNPLAGSVPVPAAQGAVPTMRRMFSALQQLAASAFMERLTLWLNHVIAGEDAAVQRLRPHAGRLVRLEISGWPALLPPLPELSFGITPAGLLEWNATAPAPPDLVVVVDASSPVQRMLEGLAGQRPPVSVSGDAALASDMSWLMDNLRWDVQDDLARVVGPGPAHELARIGGTLAAGVRDTLRTLAGLAASRGSGAR
jgi:ubiquinone biosynthesis protein UbiJ